MSLFIAVCVVWLGCFNFLNFTASFWGLFIGVGLFVRTKSNGTCQIILSHIQEWLPDTFQSLNRPLRVQGNVQTFTFLKLKPYSFDKSPFDSHKMWKLYSALAAKIARFSTLVHFCHNFPFSVSQRFVDFLFTHVSSHFVIFGIAFFGIRFFCTDYDSIRWIARNDTRKKNTWNCAKFRDIGDKFHGTNNNLAIKDFAVLKGKTNEKKWKTCSEKTQQNKEATEKKHCKRIKWTATKQRNRLKSTVESSSWIFLGKSSFNTN